MNFKAAHKIIDGFKFPYKNRLDDLFIISYPRSGSHWLKFLIANALKVHFKIETEVNFFNIHQIIPHLPTKRPFKKLEISETPPFGIESISRILHTHSPFNYHMQNVILLLRNPFDVVESYYFLENSFNKIKSRERFIVSKTNEWINHTKSWLHYNQKDWVTHRGFQRVILFRYENLKM
ncbi:MAG: sulfotransferase domain-containing protein [Melioribacteraceae bacterium]|nr:sulfotransferase domain-containing protein [Melioribacteraceae bacterium]MCF8263426.1 sulfotransferase domain-containing protein [Melioribacteraceae bacterium]MCF8430424.1 sulfotransferase domain-containing protein [Melioribacteraceae bacterium]